MRRSHFYNNGACKKNKKIKHRNKGRNRERERAKKIVEKTIRLCVSYYTHNWIAEQQNKWKACPLNCCKPHILNATLYYCYCIFTACGRVVFYFVWMVAHYLALQIRLRNPTIARNTHTLRRRAAVAGLQSIHKQWVERENSLLGDASHFQTKCNIS